jgi:hypothetical protein
VLGRGEPAVPQSPPQPQPPHHPPLHRNFGSMASAEWVPVQFQELPPAAQKEFEMVSASLLVQNRE